MKKIIILAILLIGIVGLFFIVSSPSDTSSTVPALTMNMVTADIASGSNLIDVRTPEEYASGYIDGAVNLPLDKIQSGQAPNVEKEKTLYVYCRSGNRSAQAAALLKSAGFTNVVDLGSIEDVVAIGGQVIK